MFTKETIQKYFLAEKAESWVFMAIGIVGIIAAIICFFVLKSSFYKGAAIPLLFVGVLLGVVGYTVYLRSPKDIISVTHMLANEPTKLKTMELPRMELVMKNFIAYRYIEIGLVLIGLVLLFINYSAFWKGLGFALVIMSALALTADYFAEKRGHIYIKQLKTHITHNGY